MPVGDPYNWMDGPPLQDVRRMLRIVRAPRTGSLELVCLSDHLVYVWQHYLDGRTIGCKAGYGCKCETESVPSKLYAYLGCAYTTNGQVVLCQLTAEGSRGLQLQDSPLCGPSLRGMTISIRRDPLCKGGKVQSGIVTRPAVAEERLPPRPNVRQELQRIWHSGLKWQ